MQLLFLKVLYSCDCGSGFAHLEDPKEPQKKTKSFVELLPPFLPEEGGG